MAQTKATNMRLPPDTLLHLQEIMEVTEATTITAATVAAIAHFRDWLLDESTHTEIFLKMGVDGNYTVIDNIRNKR